MNKLGATGKYPNGSLGPHDEGELQVGIAHDSKGTVIIDFGKDVSFIGFPQEDAINFAKLILKHAGAKKIKVEI